MSQTPTTISNGSDPEIGENAHRQVWLPIRQALGLPIGSGKPDLAATIESYWRQGFALMSQSKVSGADGDTGFLLVFKHVSAEVDPEAEDEGEDESDPVDVGNTKTPAPGLSAVPDATGTAG